MNEVHIFVVLNVHAHGNLIPSYVMEQKELYFRGDFIKWVVIC